MSPDRIKAGMIWLDPMGPLNTNFPNYLGEKDKLEMLDLSMELGSEFPIFPTMFGLLTYLFTLIMLKLGTWTSPGDFSDIRGKYTPAWVPDNVNQYGH